MFIFPAATPPSPHHELVPRVDDWPVLNYESPSQYLDAHTAKEYAAQSFIIFTIVGVRPIQCLSRLILNHPHVAGFGLGFPHNFS